MNDYDEGCQKFKKISQNNSVNNSLGSWWNRNGSDTDAITDSCYAESAQEDKGIIVQTNPCPYDRKIYPYILRSSR